MGIEVARTFIGRYYENQGAEEGSYEYVLRAINAAIAEGNLDIDDARAATEDLFEERTRTPFVRKLGKALQMLAARADQLDATMVDDTPQEEWTAAVLDDAPIDAVLDGNDTELITLLEEVEQGIDIDEVLDDVPVPTTRALGAVATRGDELYALSPRDKHTMPAFAQAGVDLTVERDNHVTYVFRAMNALAESFGESLPPEHGYILSYLTGKSWHDVAAGTDINHQTVKNKCHAYIARLDQLKLTPEQWDELAGGSPIDLPAELVERIANRVKPSKSQNVPAAVSRRTSEFPVHAPLPRRTNYEEFTVSIIGEEDAEDEGGLTWQQRALCAQTDPEAFFPEKGGSTREAKKVCLGCEVRAECLEYALRNDERFGIWGGLSERERRKLKKRAV